MSEKTTAPCVCGHAWGDHDAKGCALCICPSYLLPSAPVPAAPAPGEPICGECGHGVRAHQYIDQIGPRCDACRADPAKKHGQHHVFYTENELRPMRPAAPAPEATREADDVAMLLDEMDADVCMFDEIRGDPDKDTSDFFPNTLDLIRRLRAAIDAERAAQAREIETLRADAERWRT